MKVAELQQELLNMDPTLEVLVYVEYTEDYEPVHSWEYFYDDHNDEASEPKGVILWSRC